jgi:hypothetical protein
MRLESFSVILNSDEKLLAVRHSERLEGATSVPENLDRFGGEED